MDEKAIYSVHITEDGEQIPVSAPASVSVRIGGPSPIVRAVELDVTASEFRELEELARTNDIPDDTIKTKAVTN